MFPNTPNNRRQSEQLSWLQNWIENETGLVFENTKKDILAKRVDRLCNQLKLETINQLIEKLKSNPSATLCSQVIDIATINHTHFFRETAGMAFFINRVIPTLKYEKKIRIWSAAASSGAELYTLLMMLSEQISISEMSKRIVCVGTDVNPKIIEQAKSGIYTKRQLMEVPIEQRNKWFHPINDNQWQLSNDLRNLCEFRTINLLEKNWSFHEKFHVTYLRNVLYYFSPEKQKQILEHVFEHTLPSGWLITSVTENHNFKTSWRRIKAGIYQKGF